MGIFADAKPKAKSKRGFEEFIIATEGLLRILKYQFLECWNVFVVALLFWQIRLQSGSQAGENKQG